MDRSGLFAKYIAVAIALILGVSLASAGWFVGEGLYKARSTERQVTVKGLAEREVRADAALWAITFQASDDDLSIAREKILRDHATIVEFLDQQNLGADPLEIQYFVINDRLSQGYLDKDAVVKRYTITETLLLRSAQVNLVKQASQNIAQLVIQDVTLSGSNAPIFIFSGLNKIKPAMIAEATRAARHAAQQFALDSGAEVGGIKTANQGVFQILPLVETYGLNADHEITKRVRLVSTITYQLKN